ncbi:hypothetical protein DSL72_006791 [Monilinia vaccinii-corymbosi]|uniref:Fibroin-3 related protein n=1 Tax=Monilinia vaccinii-corymbosi TaxID=61207 RepID=A0A8A3PL20_9HELO|nr:hypothetical protein DSL72_006791 [Monilinia vaccinii-corymbosi]
MPHITTAMEWSRRRGMGEILLDSFFRKRSITGEVASVRESFSSWSKCMEATYCKWPVIAIIAIAGLFVLSVLWCVIRCACCGMSCCCTCFSFLKCCDCCGGLCEGKRDRSHKHLDGDPPPNPNQGYQAPAPMMGGVLPTRPEPPRYAQFEVGKNGLAVDPPKAVSEDALPPMPTWDNATKIHVFDEEKGGERGMELKELDPATGQKMPLMVGGAANNHPNSSAVGPGEIPYGRQGRGMGNGLMNPQKPYNRSQNNSAGNGRGFGPGGSPNPGMTNDPLMGYRGTPPPMASGSQLDVMGYRGPGSAMGMRDAGRGYTRGYRGGPSPGPGMNRGPGQFRGGPSPAPSRGYGGSALNEDFEQPAMPQEFPSSGGFNDAPVSRYGNQPHPSQRSRQFSNDSSRPLNPGRSSPGNTDQSYQSMQSDNSSNVGTYPPSRMPSRAPGPNGPNRMISPGPHSGSYGTPQQRGFDSRSPAPMQQQSRFGQEQGEYNQGTRRNMPRSPSRQHPSASPVYKPYTPELEAPAYPGYKPYTPGPR